MEIWERDSDTQVFSFSEEKTEEHRYTWKIGNHEITEEVLVDYDSFSVTSWLYWLVGGIILTKLESSAWVLQGPLASLSPVITLLVLELPGAALWEIPLGIKAQELSKPHHEQSCVLSSWPVATTLALSELSFLITPLDSPSLTPSLFHEEVPICIAPFTFVQFRLLLENIFNQS